MPSDFSGQLGDIGFFEASELRLGVPTSSASRKALEAWVMLLNHADYFVLSTEEEQNPYESKWLRSCLNDDVSLRESWRKFTSHSHVAKHKYLAVAFVSWHLYRNTSGSQSPVVDIISGPQWNHPVESPLTLLTEAEMFVTVDQATFVVPRFAINSISVREGFSNGRLLFADDANDRSAFGIDEIPNETVRRWLALLHPRTLRARDGSIEQIALRDLGDDWTRWRGALNALETGLGSQALKLGLPDDPLLIPGEIGGARWTPTREEWEQQIDNYSKERIEQVLGFAGIKISTGNEDLRGTDQKPDHTRTINILTDGIPLPISEGAPTAWRDPERGGPYMAGDPWDRLAEKREVLIAVSKRGIWRVAINGSALYFNPWSNIAEATVFTAKQSISKDAIDVLLFAGPQNDWQLDNWDEDVRESLRSLFTPSNENDLNLLVAEFNAEWLRIEPEYSAALQLKLKQSTRNVELPARREISERVALHSNLYLVGMEWGLLPVFEDDSWVVRDFDCPGCGRLASTLQGIKLRREQLAALQTSLGEAVSTYDLTDWYYVQRHSHKVVKPATAQRAFGFSYEQSVQFISLFENLDFARSTHCEECVQRRLRKEVRGGPNERIGLPATLRFQVLQASGFRCHYCGRGPNSAPPMELEVDHIVPVAAGGTNELGNLQAACRDCNRGKSATEIL